jgi:hypothetical protein
VPGKWLSDPDYPDPKVLFPFGREVDLSIRTGELPILDVNQTLIKHRNPNMIKYAEFNPQSHLEYKLGQKK